MKKQRYLVLMIAYMASGAFAAPVPAQNSNNVMKDACSITCYEKTPTCYVTQDKEGCLKISDTKPECTGNACVCKIDGCEEKTVIKLK